MYLHTESTYRGLGLAAYGSWLRTGTSIMMPSGPVQVLVFLVQLRVVWFPKAGGSRRRGRVVLVSGRRGASGREFVVARSIEGEGDEASIEGEGDEKELATE